MKNIKREKFISGKMKDTCLCIIKNKKNVPVKTVDVEIGGRLKSFYKVRKLLYGFDCNCLPLLFISN